MEVHSRGWILATCFFIVIQIKINEASIGVSGHRARCFDEGEPIDLNGMDRQKCFSCRCKNGYVECQNFYTCPNISGCHIVVDKSDEDCCAKCRGCNYNGVYYESDTEWINPKEACTVYKCVAGVITKSQLQCHTPCDDPIPPMPGKCCPTCPDCRINGEIASADRVVTSGDLCVKCSCLNGKMTCVKKSCPVLQCSKKDQKLEPGECCPKCIGPPRNYIQIPQFCLLDNQIYKEGKVKEIDQCTKCKCVNQTSICERTTCPILNCARKRRHGCCKECIEPETEEVVSQCTLQGKTYEEGQSWSLDACNFCKCHRGVPTCTKTLCNTSLTCPYGTHRVHNPGECCEKCEEDKGEATCMVFGDPHYKTFDGKFYTFQGLGKFQLVSDCSNHTFSIRVFNDFTTANRTSSITKRVRIKYNDLRINLAKKFRTRINGVKIEIPYRKEGKLVIEKLDYSMRITLGNKVQVLWNGQSFLEVSVPLNYKNKLCGLCGNFNLNVQDDLRMRKGGIVHDGELFKFGTSWCVGKDCTKNKRNVRHCKQRVNKRGKNPCKYLTSMELFNGCDSKLNNDKYYRACMQDMCDCPDGKCYCDSLMAYAQECKRLGVKVLNWEKNSYCTNNAHVRISKRQKHKSRSELYTPADILRFKNDRLNRIRDKGNKPIIN